MIVKFYISVALCFLSLATWSQSDLPLTNEAVQLVEKGNLLEAEKKILEATAQPQEKDQPYCWYAKGFIEKEIYKTLESKNKNSLHRKEAVTSLSRALSLDSKREHTEMIHSALRYIAVSYFNDALLRSPEITKSNAAEPEELYAEFRRIMRIINPLTNFEEYDKQIFKALGQSHYKLWEENPKDFSEALIANDYFQRVLIVDENDCEALFNLVILHYNQGVHRIRSIDLNTDISELIPIQDAAIRNFNTALPFAQKCFDQCPPSVEHYKGLMFCNRALSNENEYNSLKIELENKLKSGEIRP